jgi:NAD(P)-dependent dehydrogenase (short-subunit alcohol dehydrogenase family)
MPGVKHAARQSRTWAKNFRSKPALQSASVSGFRHRLGIIMARTGLDEAAAIEHHRRELDITRFGQPMDVAGLVAFIVSPRGRWLHGAAIDMGGGQVEPLRMSRYD